MSIARPVAKSVASPIARAVTGAASGGAVAFPDLGTWQFRINAADSYTDSGTTRATTFGQRIQQVNDSEGTNHITQTTLANKPVFNPSCNLTGKPTIRIPESVDSKLLLPSLSINTRNFSFYCVMRPFSTGGDSYGLFNFGSSSALNSPMLDFNNGVARSYLPLNSTASQFVYGNPLVVVVTGSASAISTYVNTKKQTLAAYDAATVTGGVILHRGDGYQFKGVDVYECGLIADVLTDSSVDAIVSYAQSRYGVRNTWSNFFGASGDSLTEGALDTTLEGKSHPLIVADTLGSSWKCCNAGVSGLETPSLTIRAVYALNQQVAGISGRKVFCYYGGTNDFGVSNVSAATMQTRLTTLVSQQTTAGFNEVYVATVAARGDYAGVSGTPQNWDATKESNRVAYNSWLRTQVGVLITDVIDLDEVIETTDPDNTTYFSTDKLHFLQPTRDAIAAKTLEVLGV